MLIKLKEGRYSTDNNKVDRKCINLEYLRRFSLSLENEMENIENLNNKTKYNKPKLKCNALGPLSGKSHGVYRRKLNGKYEKF